MSIETFKCRYCEGSGSVITGFFSNPCPVCEGKVNIEIDVPDGSVLVDCRYCSGSGSILSGFISEPCPVCKGIGKNIIDVPNKANLVDCTYCDGSGTVFIGVFSEPCSVCHGTGFSTPKRISLNTKSKTTTQKIDKTLSCFICYGEPDTTFAKRLYNELRNKGISTWMYSMDYTPGKRTWKEIIEKRRGSYKVLIICSKKSLSRDGVLKELEQQIDEEPDKIIPISIDANWKDAHFIIKRGNSDLKPFLLERNYSDFVTKTFEEAFERLLEAINGEV